MRTAKSPIHRHLDPRRAGRRRGLVRPRARARRGGVGRLDGRRGRSARTPIAYRFYSKFIAHKVLKVDEHAGHPRRAARQRHRLPPHRPPGPARPPLRGDRGRGTAGRTRAGRADGIPAGHDLDHRRRHLRGRGPGHGRAVLLHAARRQVARADGARGDRPVRRGRRAARRLRHHDHPARGAGARRRQRARRLAVGHLLHRDDRPDRPADGLLPAGPAARPGQRGLADRRRAAAARAGRRAAGSPSPRWADTFTLAPVDAGHLAGGVRLRRLDPAGVDAARAARLPLHLHEDRHDRAARRRRRRHAADAEDGRGDRLRLARRRARSSRARSSPSSSSPSPAARCPASTR